MRASGRTRLPRARLRAPCQGRGHASLAALHAPDAGARRARMVSPDGWSTFRSYLTGMCSSTERFPGARDVLHDRTAVAMRARQISQAHQELAGDLAAGEFEGLAEQLHPLALGALALRIEPGGEAAMAMAQRLHALGVLDDRRDLQAIADDSGIGHEPHHILLRAPRHLVDIEALEGRIQAGPALQDEFPAQAGLEDLEAETLEQHRLVAAGKPILAGVIGALQRKAG